VLFCCFSFLSKISNQRLTQTKYFFDYFVEFPMAYQLEKELNVFTHWLSLKSKNGCDRESGFDSRSAAWHTAKDTLVSLLSRLRVASR
jgi:hypothetical protein